MRLHLWCVFACASLFGSELRAEDALVKQYNSGIKRVLAQYCFECHGTGDAEGDLRLTALTPDFVHGNDTEHWFDVLNQLNTGVMPPEGEPRIPRRQLAEVVDWLTKGLKAAAAAKAGTGRHVRRLNNAQYASTIKDLFDLSVDYSGHLLEDSSAKNGFTNNASALFTSSAHMEQFMAMARTIVERAIPREPPTIHRFKMHFGRSIASSSKSPEIGRYPLPARHFRLERFEAPAPFPSDSLDEVYYIKGGRKDGFAIQELNGGNNTYYAERYFAGSYKKPDGPYVLDDGIELEPIRHINKKIAAMPDEPTLAAYVRDFPSQGRFALRVEAYRLEPRNIVAFREIDKRNPPTESTVSAADIVINADEFQIKRNMKVDSEWLVPLDPETPSQVECVLNAPGEGLYILHRRCEFGTRDVRKKRGPAVPAITINGETVGNCLLNTKNTVAPECMVHLPKGRNTLQLDGVWEGISLRAISLTLIESSDPRSEQFARRHEVVPTMRAFLGTKVSNGIDKRFLDNVYDVTATQQDPAVYEFNGDLEEFPIPAQAKLLEDFNSNLLAIGVENNQLVTRYGPSIVVKSIEFEAPLHDQWPTKAEQRVFFKGASQRDEDAYAKEIIARFLNRAYRRPPTIQELLAVEEYWELKREQNLSFRDSIKETLMFVLTTPQFLFMSDTPSTAGARELSDYQLASRLSYFLWNSLPDDRLMALAAKGTLKSNLAEEVQRLLADEKSHRFADAFATRWLQMDKADLVVWEEPLSPYFRDEFTRETHHFFREVLKSNAPVATFVDSDFAMVNQNLANYYGIAGRFGGTFRKVPIKQSSQRGGVLTNASILLANSTGLKAHPVRRGATSWKCIPPITRITSGVTE